VPQQVWPIGFTTAAILFLFTFKRIYRIIEKLMSALLLLMLAAFAVNMVSARPNVLQVAKGICVPVIPHNVDWVTIGGLIATTFALTAVIFQSYAVKAKGWTQKDWASGLTDTLTASVVFTLIGMVIMTTAAAVLFGRGIKVDSAAAMALQLENIFGRFAGVIFGIGFGTAAFSSFIVSSLMGGVLINDGLGLGGKLDSKPTKIFATVVLLIGMVTSLLIIGYKPPADASVQAVGGFAADPKVIALAIGQAATLLAVPFGTVATVVVLFDKRRRGGRRLSIWTKGFVIFGAAVLLAIAIMMYVKLQPIVTKIFAVP
jgi:Mn2+/Fe2+ NRAMP family transporter